MPLIANHAAEASVTVVWNVPSAPGVPDTRIGDEQAPEATVTLCWLAFTAAGVLKPKNVPAAMSAPVVLQTSMYPSVAGSTAAAAGASANAGTAHKAAPTSMPTSTTSLRIQFPPYKFHEQNKSGRSSLSPARCRRAG